MWKSQRLDEGFVGQVERRSASAYGVLTRMVGDNGCQMYRYCYWEKKMWSRFYYWNPFVGSGEICWVSGEGSMWWSKVGRLDFVFGLWIEGLGNKIWSSWVFGGSWEKRNDVSWKTISCEEKVRWNSRLSTL